MRSEKFSCPFCNSSRTIEREGIAYVMPELARLGDMPIEREYRIYRCLNCGRGFNEKEKDEGV